MRVVGSLNAPYTKKVNVFWALWTPQMPRNNSEPTCCAAQHQSTTLPRDTHHVLHLEEPLPSQLKTEICARLEAKFQAPAPKVMTPVQARQFKWGCCHGDIMSVLPTHRKF